ncbi:MAG: hypothetical protein LBS33_03275 [Streptococcaceae bacterium]|nr:hypothetical protein [Streptococcaceae bacterium]
MIKLLKVNVLIFSMVLSTMMMLSESQLTSDNGHLISDVGAFFMFTGVRLAPFLMIISIISLVNVVKLKNKLIERIGGSLLCGCFLAIGFSGLIVTLHEWQFIHEIKSILWLGAFYVALNIYILMNQAGGDF